jgi:excisionase family DNA binding protein
MFELMGETMSDVPALLARLCGKIDSMEAMISELREKLPLMEDKIEKVRELFGRRRKEHYLVEEIAELTGRSAYTIRRWVGEGKLNAIRLRDGGPRGKLLVPRSELDRLVAASMGADIPDSVIG